MKNYKWILLLGLAVSAACKEDQPAEQTTQAHAEFVAGRPVKKVLGKIIDLPGRVDVPPSGWVNICLPFGGRIAEVDVIPGDRVKKGQVIGYVDDPGFLDLQREYVLALQEMAVAEEEYNRKEQLNRDSVLSSREWQNARARYLTAKAGAGALEGKVRLLGIDPAPLAEGRLQLRVPMISPVNGYVAEVNAHVGVRLQPGDAAVKVVDLSHLHLELQAFAADLPLISEGQRLTYTLSGGERSGEGEIYRLTAQVAPGSNSAMIHAHIVGSEEGLRPGQYLRASVYTRADSVWALPAEAVVREGDRVLVYVLNGEEPEQLEVQLGRTDGEYVEVIGLDPSRQYVLRGAYALSVEKEEGGHGH